jgi:hypothetical protein
MPIIPPGAKGMSLIFTIEKAVLLDTGVQANNYAVYQCDANPTLRPGTTVVVTGCTTGQFNGTLTVASVGTFIVPNNPSDTKGGNALWTGFSVTMNHAAIGIEIEATVPTDGAQGSPLGTAVGTVTQ